jgi:hypothetical protein
MSSKSSSSNLAIPEDKKLYYRANGESNLPVWRLFLIFRLKNEFGADASEMIERLAVPAHLTTPYAFPVVAAPVAALSPLEERLTTKRYETEMATYIEAQLAWGRSKAFITTAIINCMSESSIARINSVYETELWHIPSVDRHLVPRIAATCTWSSTASDISLRRPCMHSGSDLTSWSAE